MFHRHMQTAQHESNIRVQMLSAQAAMDEPHQLT